jgi:hypothetical protein
MLLSTPIIGISLWPLKQRGIPANLVTERDIQAHPVAAITGTLQSIDNSYIIIQEKPDKTWTFLADRNTEIYIDGSRTIIGLEAIKTRLGTTVTVWSDRPLDSNAPLHAARIYGGQLRRESH